MIITPLAKIGISLMPWTDSQPQYSLVVSDIFVYTRRTKDKREYTPDKESTMSMEELRRECVADKEAKIVCIGRGGAAPTLPDLIKTAATKWRQKNA